MSDLTPAEREREAQERIIGCPTPRDLDVWAAGRIYERLAAEDRVRVLEEALGALVALRERGEISSAYSAAVVAWSIARQVLSTSVGSSDAGASSDAGKLGECAHCEGTGDRYGRITGLKSVCPDCEGSGEHHG